MARFSFRSPRALVRLLSAALLAGATAACDHLVDLGDPNDGSVSPGLVHSYDGARGLYAGTIAAMSQAAGSFALQSGLFTDELTMGLQGGLSPVDLRTGNDTAGALNDEFSALSRVRSQAQQAIGALALYPRQARPVMTAEAYALEGMAEVMLAELFCNGIPLNATPYGGDLRYSAAVSTHDVLTLAMAHFDSAIARAGDSVAVLTLARVGKGRALLALGQLADAAAAVAGVSTGASYAFMYGSGYTQENPIYSGMVGIPFYYVASGEGVNGLPWSDTDPRTPLAVAPDGVSWIATKYPAATTPFVLASGIEARLIEAEARLDAKDYAGWIGILQTLAATLPGVPVPSDPGAVAGNDSARVSLQFRERAYWLYLTGHRHGDTRRLVRQYGRPTITVVPTGFDAARNALYGTDLVLAPPPAERQNNSLYTGCLDRRP